MGRGRAQLGNAMRIRWDRALPLAAVVAFWVVVLAAWALLREP